jgi:hypothetical protein
VVLGADTEVNATLTAPALWLGQMGGIYVGEGS